jgi:thiamine monophosphate synthase
MGKKLEILTNEGISIEGEVKDVNDTNVTIVQLIAKNKKTKEEEKKIEHILNYTEIKKALIPVPTNFKKK